FCLDALPAFAGAGCVTAACHPDFGTGANLHAPVAGGECDACHESAGLKHPGPGSMKLVAIGSLLCAQCHERPSGDYVHGPVRTGRCDYCHDPHRGQQQDLINQAGNGVCFACHGGIRQINDGAVSRHQPVAEGHCWDCHAPHASQYRPFLQAAYPRELYVPYQADEFALCFECHDPEGFESEYTLTATGFRNGSRNLHWFHLQRPGKARVCRNCHGVHGADQPYLLMKRVPDFGDWDIPLEWVQDGSTNTCYVGCHNPKSYAKDRYVPNP
ncbi:MAG: cytochrome C, partial [Desulfuromonas sp.]